METFVIRVRARAHDAAEPPEPELRGIVEHVGSGRRQGFAGARELVEFLQRHRRVRRDEVER